MVDGGECKKGVQRAPRKRPTRLEDGPRDDNQMFLEDGHKAATMCITSPN